MLKFLVATLVLAASVTASAPTKNIVQLAESVPDLSTLVAALTAGKLVSVLEAKGPFTVFAPTNEAFAKLPADTRKFLLDPANNATLQAVLKYHVIAGAAVYSKDLKAKQDVKTVEGHTVKITKDAAGVYVNKFSHVTAADNAATNGVVHIIDTVLISVALPNITHYGNPYTRACLPDEVDLTSKDPPQAFCCPVVSDTQLCPADVPPGVTATPILAFAGPNINYCALSCGNSKQCGTTPTIYCRAYSMHRSFCDYINATLSTSHTLLRGPPVLN